MQGADLRGACLAGADLTGATLDGVDASWADTRKVTVLPGALTRAIWPRPSDPPSSACTTP